MTDRAEVVRAASQDEHAILQEAQRRLDALPTVRRAAFWFRMYRHALYRKTTMCNALERRLDSAQEAAQTDADAIMTELELDRVPLTNMQYGDGLRHAPRWNKQPYITECREARTRDRLQYWERIGHEEHALTHELRLIAMTVFGCREWPIDAIALRKARAWKEAEHDRIERATIAAEEHARDQKRQWDRLVKRAAKEIVADVMPGVATERRAQKAHAYDVLVKLLENADVDAATKEAVGRLRGIVEGECRETGRLPRKTARAASRRQRGGHTAHSDEGVSAASG